jgi:flavin reductase (DIM6/NTAB) family NADH-FMN oxidoreductase RutF
VDLPTFLSIMGAFPTGVAVVTSIDATGRPQGMTSSALCSVSADPPLMLVCINMKSNTLPAVIHSQKFIVNYLLTGRANLSRIFASKDPNKFEKVSWLPGENGMPWLYQDCLAHAECTTVQEIIAGDHVIVVGRVEGGTGASRRGAPLMYFRKGYREWPT